MSPIKDFILFCKMLNFIIQLLSLGSFNRYFPNIFKIHNLNRDQLNCFFIFIQNEIQRKSNY